MLTLTAQTTATWSYSDVRSTIQLALALGALIWIVSLFLKAFPAKTDQQSASKTTQPHIYYISGFAVFLLIELITYLCMEGPGDKQKIVDLLSFGSTLTSIILSIVAIFYTLISGKDSKEQLGKIEQANEQLTRTAQEISQFKKTIQRLSNFKDEVEKLERNIQKLSDEMDIKLGKLSEGQARTQTQLENILQNTPEKSFINNNTSSNPALPNRDEGS